MYISGVYNVYTSDDEEPECIRCDNINYDTICTTRCGARQGWDGYKRSELINIEE